MLETLLIIEASGWLLAVLCIIHANRGSEYIDWGDVVMVVLSIVVWPLLVISYFSFMIQTFIEDFPHRFKNPFYKDKHK